jgi:hypothetical protein
MEGGWSGWAYINDPKPKDQPKDEDISFWIRPRPKFMCAAKRKCWQTIFLGCSLPPTKDKLWN